MTAVMNHTYLYNLGCADAQHQQDTHWVYIYDKKNTVLGVWFVDSKERAEDLATLVNKTCGAKTSSEIAHECHVRIQDTHTDLNGDRVVMRDYLRDWLFDFCGSRHDPRADGIIDRVLGQYFGTEAA